MMKNTSKKRSYLMLIAIFTMMICLTMAFGISASAEHDGAPAPEAPVEGMVQTYSVAFGGDSDRSSGSLESCTPPVAPADSVSGDNPEATLQSVDQDQDHGHGSPDAHEHHELPPEGEGTGLKDEYTSEETIETKETEEAEETVKTEETAETVESEEKEGDELENKGTAVEESAEEELVMGLENALGEAGTTTVATGDLFTGNDIKLEEDITVIGDTGSTITISSGTHNIYLESYTLTDGRTSPTSALFTIGSGATVNVYATTTGEGKDAKTGTITSSLASLFNVTGGTLNIYSGNIRCYHSEPAINVTSHGKVTVNGGNVRGGGRADGGVRAGDGIYADSSEVTVNGGNVSSAFNHGIYAQNTCKVTVTGGEVNGYSGNGIYADSSTVTVSGGIVSSDSGNGIYADSSEVTVTGGEVSSSVKHGIYAQNTCKVTVSGGTVSSDSDNGIYADSSEVTVNGGSVSSTFKHGIYAENSSKVTVSGGTINGKLSTLTEATITVFGGTFSDDPSAYLYNNGAAVEFEAKQNSETKLWEVTQKAEFSGTKKVIAVNVKTGASGTYATISDALTAIGTNSTGIIKLLSDVSENITIAAGQNITLDLNGFTLTGVTPESGTASIITVQGTGAENLATFTLKDSSTDKTGTVISGTGGLNEDEDEYVYSGGGVYVKYGTFTMDSGTVSSNGDYGFVICADYSTVNVSGGTLSSTCARGIYATNSSSVNVSGGTVSCYGSGIWAESSEVTISGGIVSISATRDGEGSYCYVIEADSSEVTVSGGTMSGYRAVIDAHSSEVTISGGTMSGDTYVIDAYSSEVTVSGGKLSGTLSKDDSSTLAITGGKFSADPTAYLDTTRAAADNTGDDKEAYPYVVTDDVAATSNGHGYATVQKAITAAGGTAGSPASATTTVTLAKDNTENLTIAAGQNITLDLNGKTLTGSITVKGNLTLADETGTITGDVTADGGTIDISNGTISGNVSATNSGTVTVSGGKFAGTLSKDNSSTLAITGGKFSADPTAYLDTTRAAADNTGDDKEAYPYVVTDDVAATANGHGYATVQKAITAAGGTAELPATATTTVILAKDSTENITIAAGQNITLDLNGKTLTGKDSGNVITVNGTFTLKDSNTTNPGKVTGSVTVSGTETAAAVLDHSGYIGNFGDSSTLTVNSAYAKVNGALSRFSTCSITAGKFSSDPTAYLDTTRAAADNTGDDKEAYPYVVTDNVAATANGHGYATVQKAITAAGTTATEITLAQNTTENITIKADQNITLNLYGKTLTGNGGDTIQVMGVFTLTDSSDAKTGTVTLASGKSGRGVNVESDASFTMTGGTITGYTTTANGGGVCVNGTFTMTGGEISGNSANYGGGVYVNGTFTMTGGEITGNTATTQGGGVYYNNGTVTVGGPAKITGNTLSDGTTATANNLYLNGKTLSIITSLAEGAEIGITAGKELTAGDPFAFAGENNAAYSAYFTSDSEDHVINSISNTLYIGVPVAQIDDSRKYVTVQAAVDAAAVTDTVKILTDVTNDIELNAVKEITLDLNGKTLTGSITVNGKLTLSDETGTINGNVTIDGGAVTISCGTITGNVTASGGAVTVSGGTINGDVTADGGTVTISNGTVSGSVTGTNSAEITISGGTITGNITADGGTIDISNGTIVGNVEAANSGSVTVTDGRFGGTVSKDDSSKFIITGGLFVTKPDGTCLDPKYVAIENTDPTYKYKVVNGGYQVGDEFYATFEEAVQAAMTEGKPIVLIRDIGADELTESIKIKEGTDVTLDLAGYSLGSKGTVLEVTGGSLIVTDTSTDKTGKITSTEGTAIVVTGGELTVTGISEISTAGESSSAISVTGGRLTLKDTVVTGPTALTVSGDKAKVIVEGRGSVLTGTETGIDVTSGRVTVKDGTVTGTETGIDVISGRVTVKDGTVTGNDAIKVEGGKVKVLNGHIIGAAHAILALGGSADVFGGFVDGGLSDHRDGKITVYDGFFTKDPSAYIVSGYHAEAVYDSQGRLLGFVIAANTDKGTSGQGAAVISAFTVSEVDASALNEAQLEAVENLTASGKQEVVAYVLVTENDTTDSASEDASNSASDSNSNEIIIKAALLKGIDPSLIHVFFVEEDGSLTEVGFTVSANGDLVIANGRPGIYVITCANGDGSV